MAEPIPLKKAKSDDDAQSPILKTMNRLVERGLRDRNRHQARLADCYKYAMPWRHKFNTTGQGATVDLDEIFDETIATTLEDFSADMLNTFTPQKNNWIEERPLAALDAGIKRMIADPMAERQRIVFAEMARSPLYQGLQEAYLDLGPGTMVLIVTDVDMSKPIHVEAIPATDAILVRGPYGTVDTFRRKTYLRSEIPVLWPEADMSKLGPEPTDGVEQDIEVTDGCWRDWSDKGDETYQYAVQANGKLLYQRQWKGPGSCPFIVARWSRDSQTAYGVGPTYRVLPAIKTLNHFAYLSLKNYDKHVDPATSYEDDGTCNIDNGVNPGDWIPRAPGSKAPEPIESKARFDVQAFQIEEKRSIVKRAHYQDRPEQIGKTPPTAFQWADERAERARSMGTPATNLVQELQIPLYKRFVYLLGPGQRNVLPVITENGKQDGKLIALEPISPLLRAQEQEEVIRLDRFAEMIGTRFGPQIANIVINQIKYAHRLAELLGVDKQLLNDENKLAGAIQQLAPILQNFAGGKPGGQIAPPPVGTIGA
jgi:hypothetical protein